MTGDSNAVVRGSIHYHNRSLDKVTLGTKIYVNVTSVRRFPLILALNLNRCVE